MIEHLRLVTGSQMAWIDAETVRDGTPGHVLMARAGAGAASVIRNALGGFAGRRIVVLCGKGNNGGDGFVVARLARRYGADVSCYLFSAKKKVVGDARAHLEGAERAGVVITSVEAIPGHLTGSLKPRRRHRRRPSWYRPQRATTEAYRRCHRLPPPIRRTDFRHRHPFGNGCGHRRGCRRERRRHHHLRATEVRPLLASRQVGLRSATPR